MIWHLIIIVVSLILAWKLFSSILKPTQNKRYYSDLKAYYSSSSSVEDLVRKYGMNSNAFLTLYRGFNYFSSREANKSGVIAFIDELHAWVGATDPLAPPENQRELLQQFSSTAQLAGKAAMLLPVSKSTAHLAEELGYGSVMIGTEPTFRLDDFQPSIDSIASARHLYQRGARVTEFHPRDPSVPLSSLSQCNEIIQEWLSTRKIDPLSFLNKVAPWEVCDHRKYFWVTLNNRILAFLATVPIWPRNGWYFIDLLRHSASPAGSTELLMIEAIRLLKMAGAQEISLGVSPLSNLHLAPKTKHQFLYGVLRFVYEHVNFFYRFKSLYQFKDKFHPNYQRPMYLIFYPPKMRVADILSLVEAFFPGGVVKAFWSMTRRFYQHFRLGEWVERQLATSIISRPLPTTMKECVTRCPLTIVLIAINLWFYFVLNTRHGQAAYIYYRWSFSMSSAIHYPLEALIISPFVHHDLFHIDTNLLMLAAFGGLLEALAGTRVLSLCFFTGVFLSNPLTLVVLAPLLHALSIPLFQRLISESDVGVSLGILGAVGGLLHFLKRGRVLLVILIAVIIAVAVAKGSVLFLSHAAALLLGSFAIRLYLRA